MLNHRNLQGFRPILRKEHGVYISLSSEIGGSALKGACALKGTNTVFFLFLLKTYIVGTRQNHGMEAVLTRVPTIFVLDQK